MVSQHPCIYLRSCFAPSAAVPEASGMYFYQLQTTGKDGKPQVYKGKLVIVE